MQNEDHLTMLSSATSIRIKLLGGDEYWAITIYGQLVKWRIPVVIDHEQRINSTDVFIRPVFRYGNEMGD